MELISQEEIRSAHSFNFAPMIDFLFLMLSFFATLAISHAALYETKITLAELQPETEERSLRNKREKEQIHLGVDSYGLYTWRTEFQEHCMANLQAVQAEFARQIEVGAIAQDPALTEVLLHIDKKAPWESVAEAIFGIREMGFSAHPVYEASLSEKEKL